jgi:dihydrofolate reductase
MPKLVAAFSMSLDGFVAGPDVSIGHPMGQVGERLHHWLFKSDSEVDATMARETFERVGAVLLGRRTFDISIGQWEDTPYPAPSFVLTHRGREPLVMKSGTFVFVTDGIDSALEKARRAAGGKDVIVMGAETAQQYLKAGLVDEVALQLVPVLLGAGTRLFDSVGERHIELIATRTVESPSVTHLRFELARDEQASASGA